MENLRVVSKSLNSSLRKSRAIKHTPRAFVKRVHNSLQKTGLLTSKKNILVAVSGGPDSMALLYTLASLQKKFGWHLAIAHVNYNLRAKDSTLDADLVKKSAEKFDFPLYTLEKKRLTNKSEDALRSIRYHFFESLVQSHGFDAVALAHHQDDQAETVLLRLIRGSGILGLSGMKSERGPYVRPFLSIPKSEILAYAEAENIPFRLDASNATNLYLRNKIRNVLLPLLETYNPQIKSTLASTAETLQQELGNSTALVSLPVLIENAKASFSRETWAQYSFPEQVGLVRTLFQQAGLPLPTKNLAENLVKDIARTPKKGSTKDYSRLRLMINSDMIDIHFKELE